MTGGSRLDTLCGMPATPTKPPPGALARSVAAAAEAEAPFFSLLASEVAEMSALLAHETLHAYHAAGFSGPAPA